MAVLGISGVSDWFRFLDSTVIKVRVSVFCVLRLSSSLRAEWMVLKALAR